MTGAFRSWAEDYKPAEPPIDHQAFIWRRQQRGQQKAARNAPEASNLTGGVRSFFAQRDARETEAFQRRASDPVLRAQLHLQRRGWRVYGGPNAWTCGNKPSPLTDEELIAFAIRLGMEAA